jgi:hypothetical protein
VCGEGWRDLIETSHPERIKELMPLKRLCQHIVFWVIHIFVHHHLHWIIGSSMNKWKPSFCVS